MSLGPESSNITDVAVLDATAEQPAVQLQITVRTLAGDKVANLVLDAASNVRDVKRALHASEGTDAVAQELFWEGQRLEDGRRLMEQIAAASGIEPVDAESIQLTLVRRDVGQMEDEAALALVESYGVEHPGQHHFFWAVHEGNALAVAALARHPCVDVNSHIRPFDFEDADQPWPYSTFDGRYEDTALHLAARCWDEETVETLLRYRADPQRQNDNAETALDIVQGNGLRWDHAFLLPRDFGGNHERIERLLLGSEQPV